MDKVLGKWAFIIGVLVAIVAGLFGSVISADIAVIIGWVLIIAGLVIGLLNIAAKEVTQFLIAAIALLAVGAAGLGALTIVGPMVTSILTNIVALVSPAALVVALKAVYDIGRVPVK